jgi:Transmembrane domain of unknown function (DUF3566)
VGVDHHVEPPSWRPEGAASAVTEEATAAPGQADAADEQQSANGVHELNGAVGDAEPQPDPGAQSAAADPATFSGTQEAADLDEDPISYSQDDSFSNEQPGPDDLLYTADYPAAQSGYKDGVSQSGYSDGLSQPAGGKSSVPPYPAELPSQQSATATKPAVSAAAPQAAPPKPRPKRQQTQARRANLVIARLEPWSVMKFSFLMSLVAWVVLFVAVALLYYALSGLGVFAAIQRTLSSVTSSQSSAGVNLASWTSPSRVLGYTMLIGAFDIILITALSTLGAVIYNLVTHLGGGIEVTLKETD